MSSLFLKGYRCRNLLCAKWKTLGISLFNHRFNSSDLKEVMKQKLKEQSELIANAKKEYGDVVIDEVTVKAVYGGMRNLVLMTSEHSYVDPQEGVIIRGCPIVEVINLLPKAKGNEMPAAEGMFWLLCTGQIPTLDQVRCLSEDLARRAELPEHVIDIILTFPKELDPMSQLASAVAATALCSEVQKKSGKVKKDELWDFMYEDCLDLLGKVTGIASIIYTKTFKDCGYKPVIDPEKDWAHNFSVSMTYNDPKFIEMMRLYLLLHCDHGSGNVSSHTCHLIGSAGGDCYSAFTGAVCGLAAPLHGRANQLAWQFIEDLIKAHGNTPTDEQVCEFIDKALKSGPIPGYGHAVLRSTDSRFTAQKEFAEKNMPDDPGCKIVWQLFRLVPPILQGLGKVKNPWPNVDAHSGALLQHYKLTEMTYYTVLFAVSRALGTMAWLLAARGMGLPIERPISMITEQIIERAKERKQGGKKDEGKKPVC